MQQHVVRVYESSSTPPRSELLAWKLAAVAVDDAPLDADAVEMIVNRVIDNAGVAVAGLYATPSELQRFVNVALALPSLTPGSLSELNIQVPPALLDVAGLTRGLFERHGH